MSANTIISHRSFIIFSHYHSYTLVQHNSLQFVVGGDAQFLIGPFGCVRVVKLSLQCQSRASEHCRAGVRRLTGFSNFTSQSSKRPMLTKGSNYYLVVQNYSPNFHAGFTKGYINSIKIVCNVGHRCALVINNVMRLHSQWTEQIKCK